MYWENRTKIRKLYTPLRVTGVFFPPFVSVKSMANRKPSEELLNSQLIQNTPQNTSTPAKYHSSALPPFPYRLAGNERGFRRVSNSTLNPKVPIPRAAHTEPSGKLRARQACSHCREQKAKCTGRQPCQRCEEKGVDCVYGLRSRDVLDR